MNGQCDRSGQKFKVSTVKQTDWVSYSVDLCIKNCEITIIFLLAMKLDHIQLNDNLHNRSHETGREAAK